MGLGPRPSLWVMVSDVFSGAGACKAVAVLGLGPRPSIGEMISVVSSGAASVKGVAVLGSISGVMVLSAS